MSKSKPADNRLPIVLIALMKGVVERDRAPEVWQSLLSLQSAARDHVGVLGLDLMLDEAEGYAYLRQKPAGEDGESELPRLMRRFQLSYPVSLLLVLLRQRLAEFDAENSETRLIVTRDEMIELIRTFLSPMTDDIRLLRQIDGHINKVAELGFLRRLRGHRDRFEVRRILKAFINAQWLGKLDDLLETYHEHAMELAEEEGKTHSKAKKPMDK